MWTHTIHTTQHPGLQHGHWGGLLHFTISLTLHTLTLNIRLSAHDPSGGLGEHVTGPLKSWDSSQKAMILPCRFPSNEPLVTEMLCNGDSDQMMAAGKKKIKYCSEKIICHYPLGTQDVKAIGYLAASFRCNPDRGCYQEACLKKHFRFPSIPLTHCHVRLWLKESFMTKVINNRSGFDLNSVNATAERLITDTRTQHSLL